LEKVPFFEIEEINPANEGAGMDFAAVVKIRNKKRLLLVETGNNGQPRMARIAIYKLKEQLRKESQAYGVFIAPYISDETGKILEEAGIGYLDLAGNGLISFDTIYIRQEGAKNPGIQKRELRSLYSAKGERILRVLLTEPKRYWRMAEIAKTAGVSLGQIANIKKLLLDREWLEDAAGGIRLTNPSALLSEWSQSYNFSRNLSYEYYAMAEVADMEAQLAEACLNAGIPYALTGFSSAARIAPVVRYQKASAYVSGNIEMLVKILNWKPVTSGANISLITPYDEGVFYHTKKTNEIIITSAIQTYLDLQNVRGRGQEAAQAVRNLIEKTW
jgi:hypothetical protein